jgi:hypothetical protein
MGCTTIQFISGVAVTRNLELISSDDGVKWQQTRELFVREWEHICAPQVSPHSRSCCVYTNTARNSIVSTMDEEYDRS